MFLQEKEGFTERLIRLVGQTGMASQNGRPVTPGEKVPPKLTATSFCWANPALARKRKASRTARRFPAIVAPCRIYLCQRDDVNLDRNVLRQAGYFHRGTCRRSALADFSVHLIHLPEFRHVLQK